MTGLALRPDAAPAERWTLDIDIAERAGLALPRNVRRTIGEMVEEKIISDYDCVRVIPLLPGPFFRTQTSTVPRGNQGGTQDVTEYRLNDDAALLVLLRLRTPEALAATVELVNGIRDRATAMLAAAREEGRLAGLALGATFEQRLAALELAVVPKQKARPQLPPSHPPEVREAWPEKILAFLLAAPKGSAFTTAEILKRSCGIDAPSQGDLSMCGSVATGCSSYQRRRRNNRVGARVVTRTTYTRTA